mmetsp:Transcript_19660/g.27999  ORF Transcript_19660/g.27999 Transcript_19660/m.27999 type:complete len:391 (+) Transcript_19660:263-1435(+)|eukprot:CAMPEP_0201686644 /NCGR_PEP_ID=MMETSP0578-20130828/1013_1 /ASSEMBLY_ACC=CAM_ASM_000663 /TAXON_ID=267565 /ORGANISM="Skeletonema grethea, Strain CCMP 1804" /LENGTH=390 /DNA_ID=CAMNT_0048170727 /DNA_START=223 /DNA_END=1395 /DNA_ORIENTATION=-
MLRRRGGDSLPTSSHPSSYADGSGKSIKMEAPLVKAIRKADGFTKGTYIWLFISLFFVWAGWSWIRSVSASMILECNSNGCTLTINTPKAFLPRNTPFNVGKKSKTKRKNKIQIWREQLVRVDNIKWDPESDQILENYGLDSPTYSNNQNSNDSDEDEEQPMNDKNKRKKKYEKYKRKYNTNGYNYRTGGPDEDGNYDSYVVVLRDPLPSTESDAVEDHEESPSMTMARQMQEQHKRMANDPNSLANRLAPYAIASDGRELASSTEYILHLRDFNVGYTRRMARTVVSKINAYIKGRRSSFIIRESRPIPWQGLVMLILGIFSTVLCLLIGQFWEESDPTKVGPYKQRMAEIKRRKEMEKYSRRNLAMRQTKRPRARPTPSSRRAVGKGI